MTGELSPLPAALQFQHMVSTRSRTPFHRFLSTLLLLSLLASTLALFALPAPVEAGSQTYDTPGTYTFTVPAHASLTVELWGGGAGGAAVFYVPPAPGPNDYAGSPSKWNGGAAAGKPQANGGLFAADISTSYAGGLGGTAVNGDVNTSGQNGGDGSGSGTSGKGGDGANGGAGGASVTATSGALPGNDGTVPGGGGSGGAYFDQSMGAYGGPGGGGGGYSKKTYQSGVYAPGNNVEVVVGGGSTGMPDYYGVANGGDGAAGRVVITWTDAPSGPDAPTNLITTSVSGGVSLSWTAPASSGGSNLETYGIWRASSPFSATTSATLIASIATTSTSYSDTSAVHGTVYYYRLTATNGTATSSLSNQKASGSNSGRIIRLRGAVRMLGGVRLH